MSLIPKRVMVTAIAALFIAFVVAPPIIAAWLFAGYQGLRAAPGLV